MADLEKIGRALKNADAAAERGVEGAADDARRLAREYKRLKSEGRGFMPNVNQGIAEGAGGFVDLINPFDQPHALNPFPQGTGSAKAGIEQGMDAIGTNRATGEPQNALEGFGRGFGQAISLAPVAGGTTQALSRAPGILGNIAGEASRAINSIPGFFAEAFGGGGAEAARGTAERQGLPEWVQDTAAIAGGAGAGAVPFMGRYTPAGWASRKLGGAVKSAMIPYTETGGREVARQRVQELAGGSERANLLSREVGPSEIGLTPAQQTGDPNLLGLEQEAMRRNHQLRAALDARAEQAVQTAENNLRSIGGDVADAQSFFEARRRDARENILGMVNRATNNALRPTAQNSEMLNSGEVASKIETAARTTKEQERALWDAIDRDFQVETGNARATANRLIESTPRAQQDDITRVVRELLGSGSNDPFGDVETVNEMHGLYSKLREIARGAKAGPAPQKNKARIADLIADSILKDLGATADAAPTAIGRQINAARAYTAEREEIFNQGTVGRLRRQTTAGDDAVSPELSLERSIGRGGSTGAVGADDLLRATDGSAEGNVEDFLRSRFERQAFAPDGSYNARGAQTFMRDNEELLNRFPYLREVFDESLRTQGQAASRSARGSRVLTDMENPSKSSGAAFTQAAPENAVDAVFKAKRPSFEARRLAATARKDPDGQAMDGLKNAFARHVIRRGMGNDGLSGEQMRKVLQSPENRAALAAVLEPQELRRMDIMAAELSKLRKGRQAAPDIGGLSPKSPNRIIDMAARIIAARQGAKAGGGSSGASIQTANMASNRMKEVLGNLQNDKAEQILMDAAFDNELMRSLLVDPASARLTPEMRNRLLPYFTGAAASSATEETAQ